MIIVYGNLQIITTKIHDNQDYDVNIYIFMMTIKITFFCSVMKDPNFP